MYCLAVLENLLHIFSENEAAYLFDQATRELFRLGPLICFFVSLDKFLQGHIQVELDPILSNLKPTYKIVLSLKYKTNFVVLIVKCFRNIFSTIFSVCIFCNLSQP